MEFCLLEKFNDKPISYPFIEPLGKGTGKVKPSTLEC